MKQKSKIFKAKFKPRPGLVIPTKIRESGCINSKYFDFIFAFKLDDGSRNFEPVDILFPSSDPINEFDLEFQNT